LTGRAPFPLGRGLCGDQLCSYHGTNGSMGMEAGQWNAELHHVEFGVLSCLLYPTYFFAGILRAFLYGHGRFTVYHLLGGTPIGDVAELKTLTNWPLFWCLLSIAFCSCRF